MSGSVGDSGPAVARSYADSRSLILFDGVCRLCEASIRFIIRHDPAGRILLSPLQSDYAKRRLASLANELPGFDPDDPASFVLICGDRVLLRSDAWLGICSQLQGWPRYLVILRFLPRRVRDAIYDLVGRNRYAWFGRRDRCLVPDTSLADRFRLDDIPVGEDRKEM